jgi:uncharacterized protein YqgC (DUF456 family)
MLARKNIKKIIGAILIVLGIIGWMLPIVPGMLIVIIGLELLGLRMIFQNKIKSYFENPKLILKELKQLIKIKL